MPFPESAEIKMEDFDSNVSVEFQISDDSRWLCGIGEGTIFSNEINTAREIEGFDQILQILLYLTKLLLVLLRF